MSVPQPREIRRADVLIVAEEKRVTGVIVADVGPTAIDLERRHAALQVIGTVRARNVQDLQTEVRNDIEAFSAQSLTRVADVGIEHNVRREGVSATDAEDID